MVIYMKKIILIIITIILITGCKKKDYNITTIINKINNCNVAITYPKTNIKSLDNDINKYINSKYNDINNTTIELNIDYTFNIIFDRYINISLISSINSIKEINKDIVTYIYDKKDKKLLTINNIVSKNSIETIKEEIQNEIFNLDINIDNLDKLTFDENYIYFYFNNTNDIIKVDIPIHDTEFLLSNNFSYNLNKDTYYKKINNKIIDPYKKVVAFTFDDGPSKYTESIIDLLYENDANGTFFILGNKVKYYSNIINKSISYGNEIGNHSYNHKSLNNLSKEDFLYQINTTQNIIYEISGYTPKYLRPTYGNTSTNLKKYSPLEIVLWTVDPEDWKYKNSKTIAKRVLDKVKDESIVLMHDTKERTFKALKIIIPELKKQGYQFVTISQLKEVQKIREKTGYYK